MGEVRISYYDHVPARPQQWEATEQAARAVEDRLGRQRGQFVAQIGLEEGAAANAVSLELVEGLAERELVAHLADDDVRVFLSGGQEGAGRLEGGVAGLNDLLSGWEVLADQDIHIRNLRHRSPPVRMGQRLSLLSPGFEPGWTGV